MQNFLTIPQTSRLFKRGEAMPLHADFIWQLQQGAVKTVTWHEEGIPITLGFWGVEDVVGLPLSLIQPYEIRCLTSVEAVCIAWRCNNSVLEAIVRHSQEKAKLFSLTRSERVSQRLLRILVWLSEKFGRRVERGQLIDLRLTHQELAEVVGITRVSVTKLLNQFEQEGIISRTQKYIIVNFYFSQAKSQFRSL